VSLLSLEQIDAFRARGAAVEFGAFGENIVADGIDFKALPAGSVLKIVPKDGGEGGGNTRTGEHEGAELVITQIGKTCHQHCAIFETMGDCIMPREGVFAVVIRGGMVKTGDEIHAG
jgi:MOSC domain-containing protein YiiM